MEIKYEQDICKRKRDAESFLKDLGDCGGLFSNATKRSGKWSQKLVSFEDIEVKYDTNCYVSLNEFRGSSTLNENVCLFKGVFLDSDVHCEREDKDEVISECVDVILDASAKRIIPPVSRIVATGSGLATYFLYETPICDEELHSKIAKGAAKKFASLLSCIDGVKQDMSSVTPHRVVRIPGTFNESANRCATTLVVEPDRLDAEEMAYYFCNDECKVKEKGLKVASVKNTGTVAYCRKMARVSAKLMEKRGGKKGDFRHHSLFCAYNFEKVASGREKALEFIKEMNRSFAHPFSEREVEGIANSCDRHTEREDKHGDGFYAISEKTFSEMVGMSEDEIKEANLFARKERMKGIALNKARKKSLYKKCLEERKRGTKISDICKKYKIARSTLNGLIRDAGLSKIRSKKSNFSVNSNSNYDNGVAGLGGVCKANVRDTVCEDRLSQARHALFDTDRNVAILGKAGTGKTTLVSEFVKKLKDEGKSVLKIAPTGLAASNFGGSTIHHALKLGLGVFGPDDKVSAINMCELASYDVVVVDEVGSLRFDCFSMILRAVKDASKAARKNIRLVISGDFLQTFPVITKSDRESIAKLWGRSAVTGQIYEASKEWTSADFEVVVLRDVLRQSDEEFVKNLEMLREGDDSCLEYFRSMRNDSDALREDATHVCGHRHLAGMINAEITRRHEKTDKCVTYVGEKLSDEMDRWNCSAPRTLTLYAGKPVVAVKNTSKFKNGQMGVVTKVNKKSCRVLFGEKEVVVKPCLLYRAGDDEKDIQEEAKYLQMPLCDGYALTVHKVQGQTLGKVVVHASDLFDSDQPYVAFSRAKKACDVSVVGNLSKRLIMRDKKKLEMIKKIACE